MSKKMAIPLPGTMLIDVIHLVWLDRASVQTLEDVKCLLKLFKFCLFKSSIRLGCASRIPPIRTDSFTFRLHKDEGSETLFNEECALVFAISLRKRTNPCVSLPRRGELGPISIQSSIFVSFINWLRTLNSLMASFLSYNFGEINLVHSKILPYCMRHIFRSSKFFLYLFTFRNNPPISAIFSKGL